MGCDQWVLDQIAANAVKDLGKIIEPPKAEVKEVKEEKKDGLQKKGKR